MWHAGCGLTDADAAAIAEGLASNESLTSLEMPGARCLQVAAQICTQSLYAY